MKRLLISFSLWIVLVCSTVSCGTIPTGTSPVTDDAVTTAESVTDPAEPSFDADAAYAEILSECYSLICRDTRRMLCTSDRTCRVHGIP